MSKRGRKAGGNDAGRLSLFKEAVSVQIWARIKYLGGGEGTWGQAQSVVVVRGAWTRRRRQQGTPPRTHTHTRTTTFSGGHAQKQEQEKKTGLKKQGNRQLLIFFWLVSVEFCVWGRKIQPSHYLGHRQGIGVGVHGAPSISARGGGEWASVLLCGRGERGWFELFSHLFTPAPRPGPRPPHTRATCAPRASGPGRAWGRGACGRRQSARARAGARPPFPRGTTPSDRLVWDQRQHRNPSARQRRRWRPVRESGWVVRLTFLGAHTEDQKSASKRKRRVGRLVSHRAHPPWRAALGATTPLSPPPPPRALPRLRHVRSRGARRRARPKRPRIRAPRARGDDDAASSLSSLQLTSSPHAPPPSPSSDRASLANGRARATGEEATGEAPAGWRAVLSAGGGGMGRAVAGAGGSLGGGQHARRPSSASMEAARRLAPRIRGGQGGVGVACRAQGNPREGGGATSKRGGVQTQRRGGHACVPPAADG